MARSTALGFILHLFVLFWACCLRANLLGEYMGFLLCGSSFSFRINFFGYFFILFLDYFSHFLVILSYSLLNLGSVYFLFLLQFNFFFSCIIFQIFSFPLPIRYLILANSWEKKAKTKWFSFNINQTFQIWLSAFHFYVKIINKVALKRKQWEIHFVYAILCLF